MSTIDKINERIKKLPEGSQLEVLNFVEFLLSNSFKKEEKSQKTLWYEFSLNQAMRDMEDEPLADYKISDVKKKHKK